MLLFRDCIDFTLQRCRREHTGIPNFEQTGSPSHNATSGQVRDRSDCKNQTGFNDRS
jgi:hypothetical protein